MFSYRPCGIPLGLATICKLATFRVGKFPKMVDHLDTYVVVTNSIIVVHIGQSGHYDTNLISSIKDNLGYLNVLLP